MATKSRQGIFLSFDEKKNGSFEAAVETCRATGYVIWLERNPLDPTRFDYLPTVVVKIKGVDRYYQGKLNRRIERRTEDNVASLLAEQSHRPPRWQTLDRAEYADFQRILYIEGLKRVPCPPNLIGRRTPQHPEYFDDSGSWSGILAQEALESDSKGEIALLQDRTELECLILRRRGQCQFRNALRTVYGDRCLVTGCTTLAVLEAAHIGTHEGKDDHRPENGLLLRADIHTLFDLDLLGINPTTLAIELHPSANPDYAGKVRDKLSLPSGIMLCPEALAHRYDRFKLRLETLAI